MRRTFFITTLILSLSLPCVALAERLSLDQAVQIAVESHYDLRRAREQINYVEGQVTQAYSSVLPHLGLEGSYSKGRDESIDTLPGDIHDFYQAKLTASQLLYSWGKAGAAIEGAKLERQRADKDVDSATRLVKLATHLAFYDLLLAHRLVEVVDQTIEQRRAHLSTAEKRFEAGVGTELDVIRAQVEVENAKVPRIRTLNRVRQAEARLNSLLARPQQTAIEPEGELAHTPFDAPTLGELVERALAERPELKSIRLSSQSAEKLVEIRDAGNMPEAYAFGEYGYGNEDFDGLNATHEQWIAGVRVVFPFFDGLSSRGQTVQARSTLRDLTIAEEQLIQNITLEARLALDALKEARELYKASTATIGQAEKALELARVSFENSVATSLDVTDAELNLTTARSNQASALHGYMSAKAGVLAISDDL